MKKLLVVLALFGLIAAPSATAHHRHPRMTSKLKVICRDWNAIVAGKPACLDLNAGYTTVPSGGLYGLDRSGCVTGFEAHTVPYTRDGLFRFDFSEGEHGVSEIGLRDTNGDGYVQATSYPGHPQDDYAIRWDFTAFDHLLIYNAGPLPVAVLIFTRC